MPRASQSSFDLDRFIADCRSALGEHSPQPAVREVLARAISDRGAMRRHFGEPEKAQLQKLYHAPDLTILHLIWAPNMTLMPHDHGMWALIGLYEGREDNIFWRSNKEESGNRVEAAGARTILPGECLPLGQNIVHSVTNPISRFTEAIHIYGGDFFNTPRSEWDPETLTQRAMDPNNLARMFEDANRRLVPARV